MNKKWRATLLVVASLLVGSCGLLFYSYKRTQKELVVERSNSFRLAQALKEAETQVEHLKSENADLEDQLASVQHFDDGGMSKGFVEDGVNFTGQVMETEIDGAFEGWDGETIFKMMNGTIWQQASYDYTYHYAYMPSVMIYRKGGLYYMKVEDVDDEVQIRQIR